jgi:hypothetical protein
VIVEDSLSVSFKDGFGGHCAGIEILLLFSASQSEVLERSGGANRKFQDWLTADCVTHCSVEEATGQTILRTQSKLLADDEVRR